MVASDVLSLLSDIAGNVVSKMIKALSCFFPMPSVVTDLRAA